MMQIKLRATHANGVHTTFAVFVNGTHSGTLVMSDDEAASFHQIVHRGCKRGVDAFLSDGAWGVLDKDINDATLGVC